MKTVHIFCGGGGDIDGAIRASCFPQYAFDIDKYACAITQYRFPDLSIVNQDVKDTPNNFLTDIANKTDVLIGGSPCPDFSIAGGRAGLKGSRGSLFWEYVRFLENLKPRFFIFENVKGLLNTNEGKDFQKILKAFKKAGYRTVSKLSNANRFVPQNRERVFIVGFLDNFDYLRYKSSQKPELVVAKNNLQEIIGKGNIFMHRASDKDRLYKNQAPTITSTHSCGGKYQLIVKGLKSPVPINVFEQLMGWGIDSTKYGVFDTQKVKTISDSKRVQVLGNGIVPQEISKILKELKNCENNSN